MELKNKNVIVFKIKLFRENSAERELPAVKESEVRLRYFRWSSLVLHSDEDF